MRRRVGSEWRLVPWAWLSCATLATACAGSDHDSTPAGGRAGEGASPGGAASSNGGGTAAGGRAGHGGAVSGPAGQAGRAANAGKSAGGTASTGGTANAAGEGGRNRVAAGGAAPRAGTSSGGEPASAGADNAGEAGAPVLPGGVFSTDFDLEEAPISENGAWHHLGLDWTTVETASGMAYGTQLLGVGRSGPTQYDDSYAYLAGFPADQQASGVIALGSIDTSCTHEVEILLRWADAAHDARGYECNLAFDGSYTQIVRWNGPVGDYTYVGEGNVPGGVHDGDTISAKIVGDTITLSVNGSVRVTATDATFADGNPGIGLWRGNNGCGALRDYGFTSFSASAATP